MAVPKNGWFIMEIPIKMDDLGDTPISEYFRKPPFVYIYICMHTHAKNRP